MEKWVLGRSHKVCSPTLVRSSGDFSNGETSATSSESNWSDVSSLFLYSVYFVLCEGSVLLFEAMGHLEAILAYCILKLVSQKQSHTERIWPNVEEQRSVLTITNSKLFLLSCLQVKREMKSNTELLHFFHCIYLLAFWCNLECLRTKQVTHTALVSLQQWVALTTKVAPYKMLGSETEKD